MQDPNTQNTNAHLHRSQMDLAIAESDFRKKQRAQVDLDMQIRELKKKRTQIDFEIADKDREFKKIENEIMMDQQTIHNMKKKINLI